VQTIRRVFLASLFFVLTVLLAVWFFPEMAEQFSSFNSNVQGGVGFGTDAYFLALYALDVGLALLCASALFYVGMLIARQKTTVANPPDPDPAIPPAKTGDKKAKRNRRLLLIPVWFLAQYIYNLFSGMSLGQALGMMTSIESLWLSFVVVVVVILYANGYGVAFGTSPAKKPKPAVEDKK
jgi:H+/Cl- antiporter ClcA